MARKVHRMDRRHFLTAAVSAALVSACSRSGAPAAIAETAASPKIIIDGLGGIGNPNLMLDAEGPPEGMPPPAEIDPRALADTKASGVSAINVTLGYVAGPYEPFEHSVKEVAWWDERIRTNPEHLLKVLSGDDILLAAETGRVGIIYGFQNAAMMGDDASRVEIFARLGVRVIQLTYNTPNQLGDGSMSAENRGLSQFGREVVAELNANNVLVDLSHSGEQTCLDALATSTSPITISHSGCRALADLPRNKTNEELRLLADRGGVVGIYFMPFLKVGEQPYAEDVVAHIEHAINVCGEDHVGIGTDGSLTAIDDLDRYQAFIAKEVERRRAAGIGATGESATTVPFIPDMRGPDQFRKLEGLLKQRGYSDLRIEKILGGNFLRLMSDVWSGAQR